MTDSPAERLLALAARRADSAEVIYETAHERVVDFENNSLKSVNVTTSRGLGLRVIHRGRLGFSATTDLGALDDLVDQAMAAAAFGQEAKFSFPPATAAPSVTTADPAVKDFTPERAIASGREALAVLREFDGKLQCGAHINWETEIRRVLNSAGLDVEDHSTTFGHDVHALQVNEDGFLDVGEGRRWGGVLDDLLAQAQRVAEKLKWARRVVTPVAGLLPVIFTAKAMDTLLEPLLLNTDGKMVQKGASILKDRVGERMFDERITLWNDPLIDLAPGSEATDGEGVPCRRLPLFERGVCRGFVLDLQTAGCLGMASTGSAVRSFDRQPAPGHANICLEAGDVPYVEMIRGLKRGVIVDQVLGGGQSNVQAGEFAVNLDLGYLVEKGEIVGRLKNTMIAGNVFALLKRVVALSSEREWYGPDYAPAVCLGDVAVSGAT